MVCIGVCAIYVVVETHNVLHYLLCSLINVENMGRPGYEATSCACPGVHMYTMSKLWPDILIKSEREGMVNFLSPRI